MTLEIEILSLIVQIISLILLFITSVAGIKYILSNWKINNLAKKIEKFTKKEIDRKVLDVAIHKVAIKTGFRKNAKNLIEGTDNNFENLARKFDDLQWSLDKINDTLKRFENYKEREYPKDFASKITTKISKEDLVKK